FFLTIGIFLDRLVIKISLDGEIDVVSGRIREPCFFLRARFRSYNRLSRLDLFYAIDRALHVIRLYTEMVQAIAILLVAVFQDGQLHVAVGQINGLSSFGRRTRLPK